MSSSTIISDGTTYDVLIMERRAGKGIPSAKLVQCGTNLYLARTIANAVNRPDYATLRVKRR